MRWLIVRQIFYETDHEIVPSHLFSSLFTFYFLESDQLNENNNEESKSSSTKSKSKCGIMDEMRLIFANKSLEDILLKDHLEELQNKYSSQFHLWFL